MKLGRNDSCWCGSGRKYKRCHLDRSRQEPLNPWDARRQLARMFERKYCLHPEASSGTCRGKIVRAHTVQRAKTLAAIARDGHVYRVAVEKRFDGKMRAELIGINDASTFYGFCARHDSDTFAPIERCDFQNIPEQCFLLAYRPLLKEVYLKRSALDAIDISKEADRGRDPLAQRELQHFVSVYEAGARAGLSSIEQHKTLYDSALLAQDFTQIRSVTVELNCVPDVVCSGFVNPEYDFHGDVVQDCLSSKHLDGLGFSILTTPTGGAVVFSWHENSDRSCMTLLRSLLAVPEPRLAEALVRFAFENLENIFICPLWWERLESGIRGGLEERMMANLPLHPARPDGLIDDGVQSVDWAVGAIHKRGLDQLDSEQPQQPNKALQPTRRKMRAASGG